MPKGELIGGLLTSLTLVNVTTKSIRDSYSDELHVTV